MSEQEEGYAGPAAVLVGGTSLAVTVALRGQFEPIDGRYHWHGRVWGSAELDDAIGERHQPVVLRTPDGEAPGQLSDPDTWGRYRITGAGRPPFAVATSLEDVE